MDTNFSNFIYTIIHKSVKNRMMMTISMIVTDNTSSFILLVVFLALLSASLARARPCTTKSFSLSVQGWGAVVGDVVWYCVVGIGASETRL